MATCRTPKKFLPTVGKQSLARLRRRCNSARCRPTSRRASISASNSSAGSTSTNPNNRAGLRNAQRRREPSLPAGMSVASNKLINALPSLGIVAINGAGVDKVDLQFAHGRGVRVTTTPGVLTDDVADLAVGLLIGLLREIPAADAFVRWGRVGAGGSSPRAQGNIDAFMAGSPPPTANA
jgi:hypothetical protein